MRFLKALTHTTLALAVAVSAPSAVSASSVTSSSDSRLIFNAAAYEAGLSSKNTHEAHTLATSPANWATGYGFEATNYAFPAAPYTPHSLTTYVAATRTATPTPEAERFSVPQLFGAQGTGLLLSLPFPETAKRYNPTCAPELGPCARPYDGTQPTQISQYTKSGVGLLTSIDIFDDEFFGLMRHTGSNPQVIQRISAVPAKWGDQTALRQRYPQLDTWASTGQLFELDYVALKDVQNSIYASYPPAGLGFYDPSIPARTRYMAAPHVLLAHVVEAGASKLVPIAIKVDQKDAATATVYRADYKDSNGAAKAGVDQGDWQYAKLFANAADGTLHQLDAHLTKTHLIMENIITGVHVALPADHVVSRLIVGSGHSYKTLAANTLARASMLPGMLGTTFADGFLGTVKLVNSLFAAFDYQQDYVPNDLIKRGFGDFVNSRGKKGEKAREADGTDQYLYATDALVLWEAIGDYVDRVLHRAYPNDKAVAADAALQEWARLLSTLDTTLSPISAPVPGFPSSFTTRTALNDAVTAAVYKATVGHSVVNYPQAQYNSYLPVYPTLATYAPPLKQAQVGTGLTTEAYQCLALGNKNVHDLMFAYTNVLGAPIASLGLPDDITLLQYATQAAATDADKKDEIGNALQQAARRLLKDLSSISANIQARDQTFEFEGKPHRKYGYFDPTRVANAIYQ